MNKAICLIILCVISLSISGCFPDGKYHSLIEITLTNQTTHNVNFFTRRIENEEEMSVTNHGIIPAQTSESFQRASGYTYAMYCTASIENETITYGPQEIYIDFDNDYEWTVSDSPTAEPTETPEPTITPEPTEEPTLTPEGTPLPEGDITINNNSPWDVNISISGFVEEILNSGDTGIYTRAIGNYNLLAQVNTIQYWSENIDLTETGYVWDLNTSTETYPIVNYRIFDFENNYEDHLGVAYWVVTNTTLFDLNYKKFGNYSLFGSGTTMDYIRSDNDEWTPGESQACAIWILGTKLDSGGTYCIGFDQAYAPQNRIIAYISSDSVSFLIYKANGGSSTYHDFTVNISNNKWHYFGFSYNKNSNTFYGIFDDNIYTISDIPGTWDASASHTGYIRIRTYNNVDYTMFVDEAIICPDEFIDPQIFVDHYNHGAPWGAEYIP